MDEILSPEQWNDLKYKLKLKHPELKNSDLQYHEASEQDMLRMVEYELRKYKKMMKSLNVSIITAPRLRKILTARQV